MCLSVPSSHLRSPHRPEYASLSLLQRTKSLRLECPQLHVSPPSQLSVSVTGDPTLSPVTPLLVSKASLFFKDLCHQ